MSFTSLLMLRWHDELETDARLIDYATTYGESLLALQDARGFFPAWLDKDMLTPLELLSDSPETSMSVTFLLKLAAVTGETRYRDAALRAMDAVVRDVIPSGRWEDFETYWSCSRYGAEDRLRAGAPVDGATDGEDPSSWLNSSSSFRMSLADW